MNPVHTISSKGTWPTKKTSPGEPLFTLEEVASRFGLTMPQLRGRMTGGNVLQPWYKHPQTTASSSRSMYRMSDAIRWFATTKKQGKPILEAVK